MVLLFFCMISLAGCQKEEWNIESVETEESTVVEGRVITSNGTPLANVVVKVDFHKTYIQVTLKGFIPKAGDYFSVSSAFPYGFEMDSEQGHHFPDTPYGYGKMNDYLFALHDAEQKTYQVPCALNENNILTLIRKKDGVYHAEEHQLFVTEDTPENLVYEY